MPEDASTTVVGWDIGGAHVKACRVDGGRVSAIAQWPCPLWQGLPQLDAALAQARQAWPEVWAEWPATHRGVRHVATMTGEMVDLFAHREDGVRRLSAHLAEALGPTLRLYAGASLGDPADGARSRWVAPHRIGAHWEAVASANWRASAEWLTGRLGNAVLVDIGSTTTDLIALHGDQDGAGRAPAGRSDADRLASGELVYQGVVRTPLCALTQRLHFRGVATGVMNEWFATSADVYRLLGQLDPAHDQQPTADGAGKDLPATRQRLARMIGRDAREASADDWSALAAEWRAAQQAGIAEALRRVVDAAALVAGAPLVAAGCGDFLVPALACNLGRPALRFADTVPLAAGAAGQALAGWAQVCAPAVAVALLAAGPGDAGRHA